MFYLGRIPTGSSEAVDLKDEVVLNSLQPLDGDAIICHPGNSGQVVLTEGKKKELASHRLVFLDRIKDSVPLPRAERGWNDHLSNFGGVVGVHNKQLHHRVGSTRLHTKTYGEIHHTITRRKLLRGSRALGRRPTLGYGMETVLGYWFSPYQGYSIAWTCVSLNCA